MSDETKSSSTSANGEPTATRSTVPMWIIVLTLMLLFLGGVYFDHHSGWFDAEVYAPYASAEELDAYQPKSGAAAVLAQGKKVYERFAASVTALTAWANPARPRRWPVPNGSTPRASTG